MSLSQDITRFVHHSLHTNVNRSNAYETYNLGQNKQEQQTSISQSNEEGANMAKEQKRAILASVKWRNGWSRCCIYFVQDCRKVFCYFFVCCFLLFGKLFFGPTKQLKIVGTSYFTLVHCVLIHCVIFQFTALCLMMSNFQFLVCTTHANESQLFMRSQPDKHRDRAT